MRRASSLALALAAVLATETAWADPADVRLEHEHFTWSYVYDGGAIPFFWGTGALYLALTNWVAPRQTPLFFSASEGGEAPRGDSVPGYVLGLTGGAAALTVALAGDDSRWFHTKGFFESWLTTAVTTRIAKLTFGRHRPDFDLAADNPPTGQRSFFSGHASSTLSQTTYLALYLRYHVFDDLRGEARLPWWEAASYLGLAAVSTYVPYSRVADRRHHLSDVVVGSLVGATTAAAFFYWQERRYQRAISPLAQRTRTAPLRALLVPDLENPGATLTVQW